MNAFPCIRPRFLLRLVAIGAVLVCTQLAPAPSTLATAPVAATPRPVPPVRLGQVLTPGEIITIAGNGTQGYGGDGGQATKAELHTPAALAVDAAGNVFIVDEGNRVIREVHADTGRITTVAGGNENPPYGDGSAATDEQGDGLQATHALLGDPRGVAVDGQGNLFIADASYSEVREVIAATGIITQVAGLVAGQPCTEDTGRAICARMSPEAVAVDGHGNLYIADDDGFVWKVQVENGDVAGSPIRVSQPRGLALDTAGNLYIAQEYDQRVRERFASNGTITTVAGTGHGGDSGDGGPAKDANVSGPISVGLDGAGNLYIAEDVLVVRMVRAATGVISTVAGCEGGPECHSGGAGPATNVEFEHLEGIAVDGSGNLYIADAGANVVREVGAPAALSIAKPTPVSKQPLATATATSPAAITTASSAGAIILSVNRVPRTLSTGDSVPVTVYAKVGSRVALDLELESSSAHVLYETTTTVTVGSNGSASASIPMSFDPHGSVQATLVIRATSANGLDVRRFGVTVAKGPGFD